MSVVTDISASTRERLKQQLHYIYSGDTPTESSGDESKADLALQLILKRMSAFSLGDAQPRSDLWNERDIVLITYADQIYDESGTPLQAFDAFLRREQLGELLSTVHFLPFFPYSSDDGFSVIDYLEVDANSGTWSDIETIGVQCELMFDFVVNHVSQQSEWFRSFLAGSEEYQSYFLAIDPSEDVSGVTRPRSLPLLHAFNTAEGEKHVWTTFSRDQVDLNYQSPALLAEMVGILLDYVVRGARIVRLDAIAYLWKELGTNCIHLPETHAVVKLMRTVLDAVAPHVLILTETNVPHEENVSYFGSGDEAHMVYQFSLPPLLLDAFLQEDPSPLANWLEDLDSPRPGTSYFNFTASHDGVGVRPLEGMVDGARLDQLVENVRERGGLVSMRSMEGGDRPYELNISYLDALQVCDAALDEEVAWQIQLARFLSSQAFMMALQGVPAIYFHSLVGTPNYLEGVESSGINRRINRRKYDQQELTGLLVEPSRQHQVYQGMRRLMSVRRQQPAFHPDAEQEVLNVGTDSVVAFERSSDAVPDLSAHILVATNFSTTAQTMTLPVAYSAGVDLIRGCGLPDAEGFVLPACSTVWLAPSNEGN